MRKFFVGLGIAFAVLVVAGGVAFGVLAWNGAALDKSSQAYVDQSVVAIAADWNADELWKRAGPRLRHAVKETDLRDLVAGLRAALGPLAEYDGSRGQAIISVVNAQTQTSAQYVAKGRFEKGEAEVKIALVRSGDSWLIEGFHVSSPVLARNLIGFRS